MTDTQTPPNHDVKLSLQTLLTEQQKEILDEGAFQFVERLVQRFASRIPELMAARERRQLAIDAGGLPDFLEDTADIRGGDWTIRNIPEDLQDRRVEITGPVDRKMVINALNANVKIFMADFEDSFAPAWDEVLDGQRNLRDAVNGTIAFTN